MKKLILNVALLIGLASVASAQTTAVRPHKTPQQRAELMSKKLTGKLNLTADQSAKVNTILLAQATSMDSLKAVKVTDKGQKRTAVKSIMQNTNNRLSAVLTADQQKAYAGLKAQGKKHFKDAAKARVRNNKTPQQRAEMLTGKLKETLKLSPEQTNKVSSILLARATQVDSLKAANTAGNKKNGRAAYRGMFKETDAQLNAVLNADQQKAYADWKADHKKKFKNKRVEKTQG
ncbi:MAG: hypothetical protein EOP46_16165 [Sphingobacteriaceae bacterium]|nr:MAG: hypothetical protein EOP46_16165 [Sphingobacteriaceae bacterium]